jgi:hypothetical protein
MRSTVAAVLLGDAHDADILMDEKETAACYKAWIIHFRRSASYKANP